MIGKAITAKIDDFFQPRGVAIVGASSRTGTPGNQILEYAKQMSLSGKVYPVNPTADEIAGLKCYPNLTSILFPIDLVVIVVSSHRIKNVALEIKERREAKGDVGAVVVVSAGFRETGTPEGEKLQRDFVSIITASGARIIGPNCQGVADAYNGINTTFSVPPDVTKGGVSILSQSGAFATSFLRWGKELNLVGLNKFVSLGNMADVEFEELIQYMGKDDKTKVIAMYLDGVNNARGMIKQAAKVSQVKPIVAIKGGRTAMGANVAHSHTASIAGDNDIYDGAFSQAGVIRAETVAEFYHTARTFDKAPLPKGNRICLLTGVGGPSTICIDELVSSGEVALVHLKDSLKQQLAEHLDANANIGNPDGFIDMTASVTPKMHTDVLELLMNDDEIDGIVFMTTPSRFIKDEELAEAILEGYKSVPIDKRKPLLTVLLAASDVAGCRKILESEGLPTFEYPDDAAKVMVNLVRYSLHRQRNK